MACAASGIPDTEPESTPSDSGDPGVEPPWKLDPAPRLCLDPSVPEPPEEGEKPLLTRLGFVWRMAEEVARTRRTGGFLSLMLVKVSQAPRTPAPTALLEGIARRIRGRIRLHDILALRTSDIALLMPETSAKEASRAAERLLQTDADGGGWRESAGVATVFGEVEGGGDALVAAAEEALAAAAPGAIVFSRTLNGRPRVLVVDDDLAFAQMLAETLSERGWDAYPCSNIDDAWQRVLEGTYHGLFIDLMLPGSNGVEMLKRAMAAQPTRPMALMSGSDVDPAAVQAALDYGPVTFIRKPISSNDLDAALQMFRELLPGAGRKRRGGPADPSAGRPQTGAP
jgi:CheY-like chemotaxis protein